MSRPLIRDIVGAIRASAAKRLPGSRSANGRPATARRRSRRVPIVANLIDALRTSTASRWSDARHLRAQTRTVLADRRSMRRAGTLALKQALQRHRAAVIASVRTALTCGTEPAVVPQECAERAAEVSPDLPDTLLRSEVLRVIASHPEGIGALEMGNELGVDWRRVVDIARTLVDTGVVEQVDQELYPCGKESAKDAGKGSPRDGAKGSGKASGKASLKESRT